MVFTHRMDQPAKVYSVYAMSGTPFFKPITDGE